jgi:hypothetical protein
MPQGDDDKQRQQKIKNDEEEDKAFDPEGGVITTTQGLWDNHTTFPLRDSNNQSHLTQGCYNPRRLQQHPMSPAASAPAYSGLDKMLTRGGARQEMTITTTNLKWQVTIAKDKDKIKKFLENVL